MIETVEHHELVGVSPQGGNDVRKREVNGGTVATAVASAIFISYIIV